MADTPARRVVEAADVDEVTLRIAERVFEDWFDTDESINWDDDAYGFWARMESEGLDLGPTLGTPAMQKIQRHIRAYRRQG